MLGGRAQFVGISDAQMVNLLGCWRHIVTGLRD